MSKVIFIINNRRKHCAYPNDHERERLQLEKVNNLGMCVHIFINYRNCSAIRKLNCRCVEPHFIWIFIAQLNDFN